MLPNMQVQVGPREMQRLSIPPLLRAKADSPKTDDVVACLWDVRWS